jgi:hypothetical protein
MGIPLFVMDPAQGDDNNIEDVNDNLPPLNAGPQLVRQDAVYINRHQLPNGGIPNVVPIPASFLSSTPHTANTNQ